MSGIVRELMNENLILRQKLQKVHSDINNLARKIIANGDSVTTDPMIIEFLDDFYGICDNLSNDYDSDSDTDEFARVSPTGIDSETTFWTRDSNSGRLQSND